MLKIFLIIILILITRICSAEKVYVFIETHDDSGVGKNEKGDVIDIRPFTKELEPTESEKNSLHIIVVDLSDVEKNSLLMPEIRYVSDDNPREQVREREKIIDYERFLYQKQEAFILKEELLENVITKSIIINPIIKP